MKLECLLNHSKTVEVFMMLLKCTVLNQRELKKTFKDLRDQQTKQQEQASAQAQQQLDQQNKHKHSLLKLQNSFKLIKLVKIIKMNLIELIKRSGSY
jgi:citrate synthase